MTWQFMCSWPDGRLNPNTRSHWRHKAEAKSLQRNEAKMLGLATIPVSARQMLQANQRLKLRLQFVQPDRRARDLDNLIASCKALIDGVSDATGVDDSKFRMEFDMQDDPLRPGGVRVTVEEMP
jgi:crossover junction endodeoxyribonuclease RusA